MGDLLSDIAVSIGGNDWADWKTRRIAPTKLLAQRAVDRWLIELVDGRALVLRLPTYDDTRIELTAANARAELEKLEHATV